jgi:hypothetical protein
MSIGYSLNIAPAIAEHSICHPGLPEPHGESHDGSFSFDFFQRAKSYSFFFSVAAFSDVKAPSPSAKSSLLPKLVGSSFA